MGTTASGNFLTDLTGGTLPAFAFVTPDLCNDTHDCPVATGDAWLESWFAKILASPTYLAGRTVVVVAWDEDDGSAVEPRPADRRQPVDPGRRPVGDVLRPLLVAEDDRAAPRDHDVPRPRRRPGHIEHGLGLQPRRHLLLQTFGEAPSPSCGCRLLIRARNVCDMAAGGLHIPHRLQSRLVPRPAAHPESWAIQLRWFAAAALVGFAVPFIGSSVLGLQHDVYLGHLLRRRARGLDGLRRRDRARRARNAPPSVEARRRARVVVRRRACPATCSPRTRRPARMAPTTCSS